MLKNFIHSKFDNFLKEIGVYNYVLSYMLCIQVSITKLLQKINNDKRRLYLTFFYHFFLLRKIKKDNNFQIMKKMYIDLKNILKCICIFCEKQYYTVDKRRL